MCTAYLWCVLLVCFPGVLNALTAAQSCSAPSLDGGYLIPEQDTYLDGITVTYSCNNTRKPAVEGWWAKSTCLNGKWIPEPQCIDEKACLPLKIKNAEYTENPNGWYEDGGKIRITCDDGYEVLNWDATAVCSNGAWTSVPVCNISPDACRAPPPIPHAVVVGLKYKEVFAVDAVVQYECENGYTVEGAESTKNVTCLSGTWTKGPSCISDRRPATGHGSAGHSSSPGNVRQRVAVRNCGSRPRVPNGEVVVTNEWFLRYSCNEYYTLEGPEAVLCYSDGFWSQAPICRATYCSLNTTHHTELDSVGVVFLKHGETRKLSCVREDHWFENSSVATCTDGKLTRTRCCNSFQITTKTC
ncbi:complement factor H-related protein 2-like [Halichoeres trimaculatus]|uniref:complement factor H-related protein 2-like n=1 Tax=Halichoeres trimaculatus TaxID=147232 RepID=UPI003D9EAA27